MRRPCGGRPADGLRPRRAPALRRSPPVFVGALALLASAGAAPLRGVQVPDTTSRVVRGEVFDSLFSRALGGAEVAAVEVGRSTRADQAGRFELLLPPGRHTLEFRHRRVPEWAVLRHDGVVDVGADGVAGVRLSTVSEWTLLDRLCGGRGAVVAGVVQDMLTDVGVARAVVRITTGRDGDERELGRAVTVPSGGFQLCLPDMPPGPIHLQASVATRRGRAVEAERVGERVALAGLHVLVSEPVRISGVVLDGASGRPVEGATVAVGGTRLRAPTRPDGSFLLRGVPPGSVRLTVEHVGYGRRTAEVLTRSGDSIHVELEVQAEAVPLQGLVVRVRGGSVPARARMGTRFDGLTPEQVEELRPRVREFIDYLRFGNIPGLSIRPGLQSVCIESGRRTGAWSNYCQMVEVYVDDVRITNPTGFLVEIPPEIVDRIQLLSGLEAVGRYSGPRAKNGVLLIYTKRR